MTSALRTGIGSLLVCGAVQAASRDVALQLSLAAPLPAQPVAVTVRARPLPSSKDLELTGLRAQAPGNIHLALDRATPWEVAVEAEGYWAPAVMLDAEPSRGTSALAPGALAVTLWPTGTLKGAIQTPAGAKTPTEISLRFRSAPERGKAPALGEHTVACPVASGSFRCPLPATPLDLRLRAKGFVSHYRFGLTVPAKATHDLGTLALMPGASVVGRVDTEEGVVSAQSCRVTLTPLAGATPRSPEDEKRRQDLSLQARVDEKGFFQLEGVSPGTYELSAQQPGYAPAHLFPVTVYEGAESEIRQPLLLVRPLALQVEIEPPLSPQNRPWRVALSSESPGGSGLVSLGHGEATAAGRFVREGLAPGKYAVEVQDGQDATLAWEDVVLDRTTPPLQVRLPLTWIQGQISVGEKPLAANIHFGGSAGRIRVSLRSDAEGEFAGILPQDGNWEVEIEAASPSVQRRVPEVTVPRSEDGRPVPVRIELPDTRVEGEVVDEQGRPVQGARVTALELATAVPIFVATDEKGKFELAALPEGPLTLSAETRDARSQTADLEAIEGASAPPVRLVLQKLGQVSGRVTSAGGNVIGARVLAIAIDRREASFLPAPYATSTDVEGRFELRVPAQATDLQLVVLQPGFPLTGKRFNAIPKASFEIHLGAGGGTLVLPARSEAGTSSQPAATRLSLETGGVLLDSDLLAAWAALNGQSQGSDSLRVPGVAPGAYTACWSGIAEALGALQRGIPPASPGCASGMLAAGGELVLEPRPLRGTTR